MRCLAESNWTTFFSHVTKVTLTKPPHEARNQTHVTVLTGRYTMSINDITLWEKNYVQCFATKHWFSAKILKWNYNRS